MADDRCPHDGSCGQDWCPGQVGRVDELAELRNLAERNRVLGRKAERERDTVLQPQALLREDLAAVTAERDDARRPADVEDFPPTIAVQPTGQPQGAATHGCHACPWSTTLVKVHARPVLHICGYTT